MKMTNWIAKAELIWNFEAEDNNSYNIAQKYFEEQIGKYIPKEILSKFKIKTSIGIKTFDSQVRSKSNIAFFEPQEILEQIGSHYKKFTDLDGNTHSVNMQSIIYELYVRDKCICQACGLVGTKMILEQHVSHGFAQKPHFQLYAEVNGKLILFNKDHIVSKSRGGTNQLDNYQLHCAICNNIKGKYDLTNEQVKELRKIFDNDKLTKKQKAHKIKILAQEMDQKSLIRYKLKQIDMAKEKAKNLVLKLKIDIAVVKNQDHFQGIPLCELNKSKKETLDKILVAGTLLKVDKSVKRAIHCCFDEDSKISILQNHLEVV